MNFGNKSLLRTTTKKNRRDDSGRLGRKQNVDHEDFVEALRGIESRVSRAELDAAVSSAAEEVSRRVVGRNAAFAWSGGKDSLALEVVMRAAGIEECVMVITDLEFPEFLAWATDHMPARLEVVNTGQDLDWLASRPDMLFPGDATTAAKWFKSVQHAGQERYYRSRGLDVLMLGRRRADGNFVGDDGEYESRGVVRYSPIRDWSHELVLAAIRYRGLELPPIYDWPRGFRVGTGPWPARQWLASKRAGFEEVWRIDPSRVREAAEHPSSTFDDARRVVEVFG